MCKHGVSVLYIDGPFDIPERGAGGSGFVPVAMGCRAVILPLVDDRFLFRKIKAACRALHHPAGGGPFFTRRSRGSPLQMPERQDCDGDQDEQQEYSARHLG
jgi:hypothetical protein